jgi:hypothetical protein
MSKKFDPGEWAEQQALKWLNEESARVASFTFHRYPDAKAAQGALAKQPSDYLVSAKRVIYHLEVKETKQINRLPKVKVRQYGMLLKWHWANVTPRVVIYQSELKVWTWLGPDEMFCFDDCPPSFDLTLRPKFTTCAEVLEALFS